MFHVINVLLSSMLIIVFTAAIDTGPSFFFTFCFINLFLEVKGQGYNGIN